MPHKLYLKNNLKMLYILKKSRRRKLNSEKLFLQKNHVFNPLRTMVQYTDTLTKMYVKEFQASWISCDQQESLPWSQGKAVQSKASRFSLSTSFGSRHYGGGVGENVVLSLVVNFGYTFFLHTNHSENHLLYHYVMSLDLRHYYYMHQMELRTYFRQFQCTDTMSSLTDLTVSLN